MFKSWSWRAANFLNNHNTPPSDIIPLILLEMDPFQFASTSEIQEAESNDRRVCAETIEAVPG
jgi:hypothetical protein